MGLIARWRSRRHPASVRDSYMTRAEHIEEAERLAWVIDDVLQSGAKRTLADLVAIARLHLDLARYAPRPDPYASGRVSTPEGESTDRSMT
jgi:hypothetical protein